MSEESGVSCVVCCQHISNNYKKAIYAIGQCDHSVCYECSTRMRVLCQQNECPICRQQLNEVVFTRDKHKKFDDFDLKKCLYRNDYGISFECEESLEAYGKLLEHPCRRCRQRPPFKTFHDLSTHLRKEHELFLCDLCVSNLKVFSSERKYYTRKELARHRKSGDPDETSHRGHPICTFCDQRYVDDDELHLHLRREHFYCHFCDPSGLSHFYGDYSALRDHFLGEHYLCQECDCAEEKFTCAFSSEIDLQAHIAQLHSQNMSKADLKKAKTLSLDLFIRQRSGALDNGQQNKRQMQREVRRQNQNNNNNRAVDNGDKEYTNEDFLLPNAVVTAPTQPPRPEDFPSLGTDTASASNASTGSNEVKEETNKKGNKKGETSKPSNTYSVYLSKNPKLNTTNSDEFPALPGSNGPQISSNTSNPLTYNQLTKQKPMNARVAKAQTPGAQKSVNVIDSSVLSVPQTKQMKQNSSKPLINNKEEFPSLPISKKKSSRNSGQTSAQVNSNNVSKKGQTIEWSNCSHLENKNTKTEASNGKNCETKADSLKALTNFDDFPVLEVNQKKTVSSYTAPTPVSKPEPKPMTPKAPPGLPAIKKKNTNLSLSSVAQVISTTSAENMMQSSNSKCLPSNEFCYTNPIDFNERNQRLVKEVENVLSDRSKFLTFKETSKQFRQSVISAEQYHQKCIELFDRNRFLQIFSELLVLLPDIRKQNELLRAQQMDVRNTKGAIPKGSKLWTDSSLDEFIICPKCSQVLISKDQTQHMSVHSH